MIGPMNDWNDFGNDVHGVHGQVLSSPFLLMNEMTGYQVYCWWFRNPNKNHLGCKRNLVNLGINYQPQLVCQISYINSTMKKTRTIKRLRLFSGPCEKQTISFKCSQWSMKKKESLAPKTNTSCIHSQTNCHTLIHPRKIPFYCEITSHPYTWNQHMLL